MASEGVTQALADVQFAVASGQSSVFEGLPVYVVGFEASCAWPSKYTYRACNAVVGDGRRCLKSAEWKSTCSDGHVWIDRHPVYRFQLKLSDGSMQSRSLKATVFNTVSVLLKRPASEFSGLPISMQDRLIVEAFREEPKVVVNIRTGDGKAVVERMLDSDAVVAPVGTDVVVERHGGLLRGLIDIGECARNARNLGKFEPHLREHGFRGVDSASNERLLAELKNRHQVRRRRPRKVASTATATDFMQLQGSLKAAWRQTCRRKWKQFYAEAEQSALFRFGPEPKAPEQTMFTLMIDCLLFMDRRVNAGFWAERWNFDLQECVLNGCQKNTMVYTWCESVETQLRLHEDGWPTPELAPKV
ncbi:hypothetical protein R1sor_007557 [Riccia sorocarpa]|uniref:Uncharacterized protein n=1 Tax=Riccia sorocarpa TaxID=122646 RepID=A0ABD3HSZ5_9MARC